MSDLAALVEEELSRPAPDAVRAFAFSLVNPARDAAVLYYGSTLRTGDLTGVAREGRWSASCGPR